MLFRATAMFAILFLVGCAHWQKTAESWNGHTLQELIAGWGPPESMYAMGDGRKVALFRHSRLDEGTQLYCNVIINTDASGVIISSKIEGNIGGCNRFFAEKGPPR